MIKKIGIYSINNHHNHPIAKIYPKRTRNTLSTTDKQTIFDRTMKGSSAADIRNENQQIGRCSKDVQYNQRRKTIQKRKNDDPKELQNLFLKHCNWYLKLYITNDPSNCLLYIYAFYMQVIKSLYSSDVIFVDDTSCTNHYHRPCAAMVAEDENGSN